MRTWRSSSYFTLALIGLLGISTGCTNATTPESQTNENILAISSTASLQSRSNQVSAESLPNALDQLGVQQDMPYREARTLLIQQGWEPIVQGDLPNLNDSFVGELMDLGYEEVKDCSGTGVEACRFEFTNEAGQLLVVSAVTNGDSNQDRVVWRWFIEERTESNQQEGQIAQGCDGEGVPCEPSLDASSTPPILDGLYVLGGTDQGLEVVGQQYRYYDELGAQEWLSLAELTYIKEGMVFDGSNYWCIPSENEPGVCTENGWESVR